MTDKRLLNPVRLLRAVEMWLWYGRAWNVSLTHMLRYHHRPIALAAHLETKRTHEPDDLTTP